MEEYESRDERPLKRTRQACDSCRRKKSKCSGERPVCATCDRLRRQCSYTMDHPYPVYSDHDQHQTLSPQSSEERFYLALADSEKRWQTRVDSLESTLAELVQGIKDGMQHQMASKAPQPRPDLTAISPAPTQSIATAPTELAKSPCDNPLDSPTLPPHATIIALAQTYLIYCDAQPLPLFHHDGFASSFNDRDPEVIYAVLALASRVPIRQHSTGIDYGVNFGNYIYAAHQLAMSRVVSQRVELSTLQTFVLLAFHELTSGNIDQCRVHCSMASTLARCAELYRCASDNSMERDCEEQKQCYWSIVLLRRLMGEALVDTKQPIPPFPCSPAAPPVVALSSQGQQLAPASPSEDREGIVSVVLDLSEAWSIVQTYIKSQKCPTPGLAPWSPTSEYSKAMSTIMDTGQQLPPVHRYRSIRLSHVSGEKLQDAREYWGPWFLSRFVYHTSLCLLNHPILIMLQLQGSKDVSEVFLQQSVSSLSHHTKWVIHFIEFLHSRHFFVSDPIIAYCAAVAATVELHQSFLDDDPGVRKKKRRNYDECSRFILSMRHQWPCVEYVVEKLQNLAETMSVSYENTICQKSNRISIDISGFFKILDIGTVFSRTDVREGNHTMFGPTLTSNKSQQASTPTNLIRLPSITAIGNTSETSARGGIPEIPEDVAMQAPEANPNPNSHLFGNDMLIPADQLFSNYFHDMDGLDLILGASNVDNPLM